MVIGYAWRAVSSQPFTSVIADLAIASSGGSATLSPIP